MDAIFTYLFDNWPYAIWLVAGGGIVGFIMYFYFRLKNHGEKVYEEAIQAKDIATEAHIKFEKLPCEKHLKKIDNLQVMNAKLDGILQTLQNNNNNPLFKAHSPISLTQKGIDLKNELGIDLYIDKNWTVICPYIKKHTESKNPYDVQQFCFDYVISKPEEILSDEGYDKLKQKAFDLGIPAISILQVVSLVIRDRYFKEHELRLADVDKHDPSSK